MKLRLDLEGIDTILEINNYHPLLKKNGMKNGVKFLSLSQVVRG